MTDEAMLELVAAIDRNTEAVNAATKLLARLGEERNGKKEKSPLHPPKGKKGSKEETTTTPPLARARVRVGFAKPTLQEVAAYVRDKGFAFDPEQFWNYYESNGWRVGSHAMKSWQAACVTWQKKECRDARREAARQAHIDARIDERERMRRGEEPAAADLPRPSDFLVPGTFGREG